MRHVLWTGLALVVLASPAGAAPKVWSQDWAVTGRPIVRIRVDDAHVRIRQGPDGRVSSRAEYDLRRWGLVIGVSSPTVLFERSGNEFRIEARDPKGMGVIGGMEEHFVLDVVVPREVTLEVRSSDGALDCDPLEGSFRFESGDGAIRAHGLKGDVSASTRDGRVQLDDLDGTLAVRLDDGPLVAAGRFDLVQAKSSDGRLSVTARPGSAVKEPWSLESRDGHVTLLMPVNLATLLDASSRDGRLRVNLPIPSDAVERHHLVGELNGGGPLLRVRTQDGAITLGLSE